MHKKRSNGDSDQTVVYSLPEVSGCTWGSDHIDNYQFNGYNWKILEFFGFIFEYFEIKKKYIIYRNLLEFIGIYWNL